jgi:hypothetical protein
MQAHVLELPRLRTLARQALPHLVEATLVPAVLFYVMLRTAGVHGALAAGLAWSYAALGRRLVRRERIPGVLVIGALGITARTALALATGNAVVYFLQPTLTTAVVATAFLASVPSRQPLAERLAADFCPIPETMLRWAPMRRFFRRISLLWGGVQLANAAVTAWLLATQPLTTFVVVRAVASLLLTGGAIAVSTVWFFWSMRRHGLVVARVGGR